MNLLALTVHMLVIAIGVALFCVPWLRSRTVNRLRIWLFQGIHQELQEAQENVVILGLIVERLNKRPSKDVINGLMYQLVEKIDDSSLAFHTALVDTTRRQLLGELPSSLWPKP